MALVLKSGGAADPVHLVLAGWGSSCVDHDPRRRGRGRRDFCDALMDVDESFGIKSAFQVVPETQRGATSTALVEPIRERGFEVNLHDLNHDGHLFAPGAVPRARARASTRTRASSVPRIPIRRDVPRAGWFDAFEFSYDMSVPNAAHLEPQRGGCCTVMPYFIGKILELPLTTIQDYSLFHILGDYSIAAVEAADRADHLAATA